MAKKRKAPKPQAAIPVDPNATVFQPGDEIVVQRRPLWTGYRGTVESVEGGMCRCRIRPPEALGFLFHADIPASELKLDI